MSVYTKVDQLQLEGFLIRYSLGQAKKLEPIPAGITNTNYYLETDEGRFVLTLYEHHGDDELDFLLGLQRHLAQRGIRCPAPVADRRGDLYSTLNRRPTAIIEWLTGAALTCPRAEHCATIGSEIARFHLQGLEFSGHRTNPRGASWLIAMRDMLGEEIPREDLRLLDLTLDEYRDADFSALPGGPIHADLFRDNALFEQDSLIGIIDFDYACSDAFAFDIAVTLNDWCLDETGRLDTAKAGVLLDAYRQQRPLEAGELEVMPLLLRVTALRFWLSRLYDKLFPLSGELAYCKDPDEFRSMLAARDAETPALRAFFRGYQEN